MAEPEERKPERTVTQEGKTLISNWLNALERKRRAGVELTHANAELDGAEQLLGAWIAPPAIKPKPGEVIAIWFGDSLVQCVVGAQGYHTVEMRFRGVELERYLR